MRVPAIVPGSLSPFVLAAAATAGELTVGVAGSGADFTDVQAAIDAAQPGDRITVGAGSFPGFVLAKPLSIFGSGASTVIEAQDPLLSQPIVSIRSIAAGERAALSGLSISGAAVVPLFGTFPTIRVTDSPGIVAVHDVAAATSQMGGVGVFDSDQVVLVDAELRTGSTWEFLHNSLLVEDARVWVSASELAGWDQGVGVTGDDGFDAVEITRSEVVLSATSILGGSVFGTPLTGAGDGGVGLIANDSRVEILGGPKSSVGGGDGALGFVGSPALAVLAHSTVVVDVTVPLAGGVGGDGMPSDATLVDSGTLVFTRASRPTIAADAASVAPGEILALTLSGEPGARGHLFASPGLGAARSFSGGAGTVLIDVERAVALGAVELDGAGLAQVAVAIPDRRELEGVLAAFQWVARSGEGEAAISDLALSRIE